MLRLVACLSILRAARARARRRAARGRRVRARAAAADADDAFWRALPPLPSAESFARGGVVAAAPRRSPSRGARTTGSSSCGRRSPTV